MPLFLIFIIFNSQSHSTIIHSFILHRLLRPELEFLKGLWGLGTGEEEGYRTGPPGYIRWGNSFLGIDSGAPYTFKNTSSVFLYLHRFFAHQKKVLHGVPRRESNSPGLPYSRRTTNWATPHPRFKLTFHKIHNFGCHFMAVFRRRIVDLKLLKIAELTAVESLLKFME